MTQYRSSITGRWVDKIFALANGETTESQATRRFGELAERYGLRASLQRVLTLPLIPPDVMRAAEDHNDPEHGKSFCALVAYIGVVERWKVDARKSTWARKIKWK